MDEYILVMVKNILDNRDAKSFSLEEIPLAYEFIFNHFIISLIMCTLSK